MKKLTKEQILNIQKEAINRYGGIHGIRDEGLFDSAINAPYQTFGGEDLYPSVESKIAKLAYSLIKNHPFLDGNKRVGVNVFLTLLYANNINIEATEQDVIELGLAIADGTYSEEEILRWIEKYRKE